MSDGQSYPGANPESQSKIVHVRFDVQAEPVHRQLLTWRERIGPIMDVVPTRAQIERPFRGSIDWYEFGDLLFADSYTDELTLERTGQAPLMRACWSGGLRCSGSLPEKPICAVPHRARAPR